MKNIFSSPQDLQNIVSLEIQLKAIVGNTAHMSYTLDNMNKTLIRLAKAINTMNNQKQVDEFYEERADSS